MSTKKENIAPNAGFRQSLKEVCRMISRRIGASRAVLDLEANAGAKAMRIFGTHMYSTNKRFEN